MTKIINDFSDSHYSLNLFLLGKSTAAEMREHCIKIRYQILLRMLDNNAKSICEKKKVSVSAPAKQANICTLLSV